MSSICIIADQQSSSYSQAKKVAEQLQVSLNPSSHSEFDFILNWSDVPVLIDRQGRRLSIDFINNKQDYHRIPKGKNELLARALGFDKGIRQVIDLTAGLGIDSVFLARIGFQVTAIERNIILATLLQEAQRQAQEKALQGLQFINANGADYIENLSSNFAETAIYFDPMYPHKNKSALPKQEMVLFRELVGNDEDAAATLVKVLQKNFARVAVKRPVKSEPLLPGKSHSLESKLVRLDVYLPKKR